MWIEMDPVLFLGVETGYNEQGITFSEETIALRQANPDGLSLPYLARMALERSNDLEPAYGILDKHATIGGYGTVWSAQKTGSGMVAELTPTAMARHDSQNAILMMRIFNFWFRIMLFCRDIWIYSTSMQ
ncbi:hypothetical protein GF407_10710 [candidate division KSB1 bacterium]|nr:hypothetical protein [candidate division KSB1 bacterium]